MSSYGHKAAQFVDLLGYLTISAPPVLAKVGWVHCPTGCSGAGTLWYWQRLAVVGYTVVLAKVGCSGVHCGTGKGWLFGCTGVHCGTGKGWL